MIFRKINVLRIKSLEKEAELVREFLDELIELLPDYHPSEILNFDEIKFEWDQDINHTYDFKGKVRIAGINSIKTNHAITILLAVSTDGRKFQRY